MRMSEENKAVNELHEVIMDELRGEPVAIQIKVAFAVLVTAMIDGAKREPDEMRRAALELRQLMNLVQ
jgi:hypothetical protein